MQHLQNRVFLWVLTGRLSCPSMRRGHWEKHVGRYTEGCLVQSFQNFLLRWNAERQTQVYQLRHTEAQCAGSQWSCACWSFALSRWKLNRGEIQPRELLYGGGWSKNCSLMVSAPGGSSPWGFQMGLMDDGVTDSRRHTSVGNPTMI